jgi:hypothetical protein
LGLFLETDPFLQERFSCFLKDTDNSLLQEIRISLVRKLTQLGIIKGKYLSVDSCPILANVKENNLKTSVRYRFLKDRPPKNDSDCRIGVFPTFTSGKTKVSVLLGIQEPYHK